MGIIHLDETSKAFIDEQVRTGAYKDADDVVRAGLRLLHERKLSELRSMVDKADRQFADGEFVSFSDSDNMTDYIVAKATARK
jgi:antitoxin ParD1/3/4